LINKLFTLLNDFSFNFICINKSLIAILGAAENEHYKLIGKKTLEGTYKKQ